MSDKETLIRLISAAGENLVFNLGFIPADKFNWQPSSTAKSGLEIVNHLLENFNTFNTGFDQGLAEPPVSDVVGAKDALRRVVQSYVQNLRDASTEKLAEEVHLPGMAVPLGLLAQMAVIDTLNHHGQITYIQSLLGDDESHFAPDFFGHLA